MKIGEDWTTDGDKVVHKRTFDFSPVIDSATELRTHGKTGFSENRHIGRIPLALISIWLKEAGVKWDDPARSDVIKARLLSGDYAKFRVWEGTF